MRKFLLFVGLVILMFIGIVRIRIIKAIADCVDCGTCQSVATASSCAACHLYGLKCIDECCNDDGLCCGGGGGGCYCSPDPCSVNCANPTSSSYRRNANVESDFVRDCSDPCNPREYYCSCTNYTNSTPSCSISLPSTITYDAEDYTLGTTVTKKSSPQQATLRIYDRDEGDSHQIVGVTISSNCLEAKRSDGRNLAGTVIAPSHRTYTFNVRALGALDGISPNLTGANSCRVTVTIRIKDLVGDRGDSSAYRTCSATTTVIYPPPRLTQLQIVDNNSQSIYGEDDYNDGTHQNSIEDNQFTFVGSTSEDPHTADIVLKDAGQPTQTLAPVDTRFTNFDYKKSDHNFFTIRATISDDNGNNNLNTNTFKVGFYTDAGGSFLLPLVLNSSAYYGVDSYGNVLSLSSGATWNACLSQNYVACVHILDKTYVNKTSVNVGWSVYLKENLQMPQARYWFYVDTVKDTENALLFKNQTSQALEHVKLDLLDSSLPVRDREDKDWSTTYGANSYMYFDLTPPVIDTNNTKIIVNGTDTAILQVVVKDENHQNSGFVPELPDIPIARTYIFATNDRAGKVEGVSNRFLQAVDGGDRLIKGQDFGDSSNIYGWSCVRNSATQRTCTLKFKRLFGGDSITYGFCVYDKAGNTRCYNSDNLGLTSLQIGRNWIKTSLQHVYSQGGFANLPDYNGIVNTIESPGEFQNIVQPFNATDYASLSTFLLGYNHTQSFGVKWGYNNHYNSPAFVAAGLPMNHVKWQEFLFNLIKTRCEELNSCHEYAISTESDLVSALQDTNYAYKVMYLLQNVTLTGVNKFTNNNIIVVQNNKKLKIYNLLKNGGFNSTKDSLLIVAGDNSSVIIDDNPDEGYTASSDVDVIEAGFMMLENASFKVLQGIASNSRDSYKDSNDKYDRLIIHGFVYSQSLPVLERDLVLDDNKRYPSEWFIYDYVILSNLQPVLGRRKIQTFNCAIVDSVVCR